MCDKRLLGVSETLYRWLSVDKERVGNQAS
jgi:hypothetical protein